MTNPSSVRWRSLQDTLPYLPASERTRIEWPDGKKVALWFAPNIEFYELMPFADPAGRDQWARTPHPDTLSYSYRDYGNRQGIWRMFDLVDEFEIPCTTSLNFAILDHFPEIRDAMKARDFDYMSHGIYNTRYIHGYTEEQERAFFHQNLEIARRHGIDGIPGMLSPYAIGGWRTPRMMAEAGLRYIADFLAHDVPTPVRLDEGRLVALPYSLDLNDAPVFRSHADAGDFARLCADAAAELARRGQDGGRVMCVAVHPYVIGQPHRISALRGIFEALRARDDIWFATGSQITDHYLAHYYDIDAAKMGMGS